jgi:hypothetical protein
MKITRARLKQIVLEEYRILNEQEASYNLGGWRELGQRGFGGSRKEPSETFGEQSWSEMDPKSPDVQDAMAAIQGALKPHLDSGLFHEAAQLTGISVGLLYGTIFDEGMRYNPTGTEAEELQQARDDPDWSETYGGKAAAAVGMEPATGIGAMKAKNVMSLFVMQDPKTNELVPSETLDYLDPPAEVRAGDRAAIIRWLQNDRIAIHVAAQFYKRMKEDWKVGRPDDYEIPEDVMATIYSLGTEPQTPEERTNPGLFGTAKTPDPGANNRGKRIADMSNIVNVYEDLRFDEDSGEWGPVEGFKWDPKASNDPNDPTHYDTIVDKYYKTREQIDAEQADYEELHYPEPVESDAEYPTSNAEYIDYPTSPSDGEDTIEIEDEEDVEPVPIEENILQKMIRESLKEAL